MFRRILVACDGSTESGPAYETNHVSFNPLRRAHRVRDRACKVRPVDCRRVAIVALLWNVAGRTLRPDVSSKKHDHNTFTIQGVVCNFR
jgi:hypothetical protein